MKLLKKNQVIIYVIALMLVTAGYLNYTTTQANNTLETSLKMEEDDMQLANIGDAVLVSSRDVTENVVEIDNNTNEINVENTKNSDTNTIVEKSSTNSNEYFIKSKLERDKMYSQMIETYEKILNSSNSLEIQKQTASKEITKINETKNSIMICENLILTKGFENNVIFVNGESISVIIGAKEINPEQIAQIQNIIARELKADIENTHISLK